jgi:hypothetical protein
MAVAITERRQVRGLRAIAERPDKTRVTFVPFPTPLFADGEFVGAVNMLIDVTDIRQIEALREQARRCRLLAADADDGQTADILRAMAQDYEVKARDLENG